MPMRAMFRLAAAAALALAFIGAWGALRPADAQIITKQVQLTEKQVEGFIAAQKQMAEAKESEFESIAKAHGFASLADLDTVEANILLVLDGLDPDTKAYAEPPVQIKRQIDEVNGDKSIADAERKQQLEQLNEALKTARPLEFPGNVDLVKRYYDRIMAVLQP
jgi:hypothetical protein